MKTEADKNILWSLFLVVISALCFGFPLAGIALAVTALMIARRARPKALNKKLAKTAVILAVTAISLLIAECIYLFATFRVG